MFRIHERARSTSGFTLVEIAMVLVLFGILVALAAPNLAGYVRSTKMDGAINELSGDVAYTRMLAVRSGQQARLTVLSGGTSYIIEVQPMGATVSDWRVAKRVDLATDYRGLTLSPAQSPLTFNSRGLLLPSGSLTMGQPMTIVAQQGNRSAAVQVVQGGRVYREY
jgi:type IV fimbrial biogenesis protein FimT/type IV fimbrial biogenesis protein FimU